MKPFMIVQCMIFLCSFLLLRCSDHTRIAGATDMPNETASVSAVIHDSTGTPVRHAAVIMARAEYLAPLPQTTGSSNRGIFLTVTDENGLFFVDSLDSGSYMIEVNDGSSSACRIHCTIGNDTGTNNLGTFAVQPYAAITGKIDTLGNSAGQRYIQIYGLNRIIPVESDGFFSVGGLPADLFTIRIVSIDTTVKPIDISDIRLSPGETRNLYAPWVQSMRINLNTTLSGAGVSGNVYGFPVLVRLNATNFNFSSAQIDGRDIRFAKSDNTMLPYEIERWDAVAGLAEVWVKVDTVFGNNSTQPITMYWGNSNSSDKSDGTAVFDTGNGFQGVWHLAEEGNKAAKDATINHYNGTPTGMSAASAVDGIIGGAQEFDGSTGCLTMANTAASTLNFAENGPYTVSAWVYDDTLDGAFHTVVSKGNRQYSLGPMGSQWGFSVCPAGGGYDMTNMAAAPKAWTHLVGVRNGPLQFLFVNGICVDSSITNTFPTTTRFTGDNLAIGKNPSDSNDFFNGILDEVCISGVARDPAWIKLSYMNQMANDRLVAFR